MSFIAGMVQKINFIGVPKNTAVVRQREGFGSLGDVYFLLTGTAVVYKNKTFIGELTEGSLFGEMSVLHDRKAGATIITKVRQHTHTRVRASGGACTLLPWLAWLVPCYAEPCGSFPLLLNIHRLLSHHLHDVENVLYVVYPNQNTCEIAFVSGKDFLELLEVHQAVMQEMLELGEA